MRCSAVQPQALLLCLSSLCVSSLLAAGCVGDDGSTPSPTPTPDDEPPVVVDDNHQISPLSCPGGAGCAASDGRLQAAFHCEVVTPVVEAVTDENGNLQYDEGEPFVDEDGDNEWDPSHLAGFDIGREALGVHDDIEVCVLVLDQGDVRVGVVSFDTVGLFHDESIRVRQLVQERDLQFDNVVVATTHNHEAPDTMGIWPGSVGVSGIDEQWQEELRQSAAASLELAVAALIDVNVKHAVTDGGAYIKDTRLPEVIDPDVHTLQFIDDDDGVVGTWMTYGNHPESLGGSNPLITSDYPGYVRNRLRERYVGSEVVFTSGPLGGLMAPFEHVLCPDVDDDSVDLCPRGTFERAETIGHGLADAAADALDAAAFLDDDTLAFKRAPILLPADNPTFFLAFKLGMIDRGAFSPEGDYYGPEPLGRLELNEMTDGGWRIGSEVSALQVGSVVFFTVPGELYPELWLEDDAGGHFIERPDNADYPDAPFETPLMTLGRQAYPDATLVMLNNANDALGYLIPKAQFDREAPWAYKDNGQYGEQNSLGPDAPSVLLDAFAALLETP